MAAPVLAVQLEARHERAVAAVALLLALAPSRRVGLVIARHLHELVADDLVLLAPAMEGHSDLVGAALAVAPLKDCRHSNLSCGAE